MRCDTIINLLLLYHTRHELSCFFCETLLFFVILLVLFLFFLYMFSVFANSLDYAVKIMKRFYFFCNSPSVSTIWNVFCLNRQFSVQSFSLLPPFLRCLLCFFDKKITGNFQTGGHQNLNISCFFLCIFPSLLFLRLS